MCSSDLEQPVYILQGISTRVDLIPRLCLRNLQGYMVKLQLCIMLELVNQVNSNILHIPVLMLHGRWRAVGLGRNVTYPCKTQVWVPYAHKRQGIYGTADQLGTNRT